MSSNANVIWTNTTPISLIHLCSIVHAGKVKLIAISTLLSIPTSIWYEIAQLFMQHIYEH